MVVTQQRGAHQHAAGTKSNCCWAVLVVRFLPDFLVGLYIGKEFEGKDTDSESSCLKGRMSGSTPSPFPIKKKKKQKNLPNIVINGLSYLSLKHAVSL